MILTLTIILGLLPVNELNAMAASDGVISMSNAYITVDVSEKNGGFAIRTEKGDKLNKSDDNKDLLYHSDEYDTSFTSFEVTYADGSTREYLFGGSYGFLGLSSSDVKVTRINDSEIHAVWSVDNLTFTQKLSLVNSGANEHGMVSIAYDVVNKGSSPVSVKARILLDTALGNQDYGCYQVIDTNNMYRSIKTETVITASDSIPQNFFAFDDPYNPTITAYTVSLQGQTPYQVAFGHWNNLASTLFNFAPNNLMDFTDKTNKYLTADSAYALYYDLGSISASGGTGSLLTYYGVYSHENASEKSTMTVDITAPTSLSLNSEKKDYIPLVSVGQADFSVNTVINNLMEGGNKYDVVTLAIYTAEGIMPLDKNGDPIPNIDYDTIDPYTRNYVDIVPGQTITDLIYFAAKPPTETQFRKIKFQVFDTSSGATLTEDKLLGEKVFYILCPGTDGNLPQYTFTSMTPDIIYYTGTRHIYVTGNNIGNIYTCIQSGLCVVRAYDKETKKISVTIPKENVLQPDKDKLDIILTQEMMLGSWILQFEFSDAAVQQKIVTEDQQKLTADILTFIVSDDEQYKNDSYGVVAIVQTKGKENLPAYRIKTFPGESVFREYKKGKLQDDGSYKKEYEEILTELRGEFEIVENAYDNELREYVPTKIKATSVKGSDGKVTNCITINNCIDFEDGVLTVFYTNTVDGGYGPVHVHFDGSLYTSNSRTSIWKGEAAFTKIEQGVEYGLIRYDENGERDEKSVGEPILLVWPSVYGMAQSIAGMAFQLAYGQLGVMMEEENGVEKELGRVISFSAKLDLGFLIPSGKSKEKEDNYWTRLQGFWRWYKYGERGEYADWLYENYDKGLVEFATETNNENKGAASVMVKDILYGCGAGFIGVNFKVNVAIPNYVEGLPRIEGTLEINTINNWKAALEGKVEFSSITFEAALTIKGYGKAFIPDKFYLFVTGFEPGFNIDTFGVIWITGGGGGFDNLYDTIFLSDGLPPLKLLISVTFDLLKVLSARADIELSLRGVKLSAQDIKIKVTKTVAVKKADIQFDWYPDFALQGYLSLDILGIVKGSGYIVVDEANDWFVEAFARAGVAIPESIPIVGGMNLVDVDLGINSYKIWGRVETFLTSVGITYYWGKDFNFGTGDYVKPTYPELLGLEDVPVYYDEENDQTLYMRVGTNFTVAAQSEVTDNLAETPRLMSGSVVYSDGQRLNHKFNLGIRSGNDAIVLITFKATSRDDAKRIAETIINSSIRDASNNKYKLVLYNGDNLDTANANVTYDPATGKGAFSFTMTSDDSFNKDWLFTTPVASDIILYNVAEVPEISSVDGNVNGNTLNLEWKGSLMDEIDKVTFYLVSDKDNVDDSGYALGTITDGTDINSGKASYTIPSDIPSGEYYIRAVYSQDDVLNDMVSSVGKITIDNPNTPKEFSITEVKSAGDLKFDISIDNPSADAYIVNIYQYDNESKSWIYSDINGVIVEKENMTNNTLRVGGSYTFTDDNNTTAVKGLTAGVDYRIGVIACNYIDSNNDEEDDTLVAGEERFYATTGTVTDIGSASNVQLHQPKPPVLSVTADKTAVPVLQTVGNKTEIIDTFASSDITFTVSADQEIKGTWTLDGDDGITGTINGKTDEIKLTNLTEGDHTLIIKGTGEYGDGFRHTYSFTVDTLAPRLLLNSPVNGSFFNEDGTLTITGITDPDARFSVYSDGVGLV